MSGPPRVVVVNGLQRTGSTLVFHAVQSVLEAAGVPFLSAGADFGVVDGLIATHLHSGQGCLTIKTHRWMPLRADPRVVVFYTTRNLADVARSLIALRRRRGGFDDGATGMSALTTHVRQEISWQSFFNKYCAGKFDMHTIHYEDYYEKPAALAAFIAGKLGLPLDDAARDRLATRLSVDAVKEHTDAMAVDTDPVTQFRKHHVSEGKGRPDGSTSGLPAAIVELLQYVGKAEFEEATSRLRTLDPGSIRERIVADLAASAIDRFLRWQQLPGLERWRHAESRCETADDVFAAVSDILAAASAVAQHRGVARRWEEEFREHASYALARLDGIAAPAVLPPVEPVPQPLRRGTPDFDIMLLEATVNLLDILGRMAEALPPAIADRAAAAEARPAERT